MGVYPAQAPSSARSVWSLAKSAASTAATGVAKAASKVDEKFEISSTVQSKASELGAAAKEKAPAYTPPPEGARLITMKEIEEHDSEDDTWILVKDKVYDCNAYIKVGRCKLESVDP